MRVFVTDGENRAALAVTRSLGRRGHEVIVGEKHTPSLAQTSKHCAARVVYPDPAVASEDFVAFVARTVRERRIDMLVPVADITTLLLTAHRASLPESCALPFAPVKVLERAADKVDLVQTAMRIGVPVPRSVVVRCPDEVPDADLGFPVVIKPRQSRVRTASGWMASAVSFAADRDGLIRDVSSRPRHEFPVMLQERIVGPGLGVFAFYHEGRPVALFGHRRLRERPPWGGVSVLSESVELSPLARDYATRLLDELGWHGVAMVEFKHDDRDGVPKLMEINGRFWGSLQLAIDAGVDFPALVAESVSVGRFDPQPPYRVGVRNRWFWGDVDSLLLSLFANGNGGPVSAGRLSTALEFMRLWDRNLHYENPKLGDLSPWWFETGRWLRKALPGGRRAAHKFVTRQGPTAEPRPAPPARAAARIVETLERTGLSPRQWNDLARRGDTGSIFQTHEWTRSWWTTFGGQYEPLFVTVADGASTTAVAPMVVERTFARERVIRFVGDGRADYCDILGADEGPALAAVLDALRDYGRWDVMELNNVPARSRTVERMTAICEGMGYRVLVEDQFICPTLLVEGHEDSALKIFHKPSLRRPQNYFARHGRLVCRNLTDAPGVEPYLDRFFEQHIARWTGTHVPSLFLNPRNQSFYRELTAQLTGTGWLLFSAVELDGHPIALHYGFDYSGSVIWYKPSFDLAHGAHSPGLVLVRHLIGHALSERRRELDFTVGDEPFKRRFTNFTRKTVRIQVFRDPARYMLERSRRKVIAAIKKVSAA